MKSILIDLPQPTSYYAGFYVAAFLAAFIILIAEGRRRKIRQLPWLTVITSGFISFVIGCRIAAYSANDWSNILENQPIDHTTGLVMIGGLLLSVPFILITKKLVRLSESVLDAYAFVLPVGMCLQRFGCFINGCCFGTTTPRWGVQYAMGTSAFHDHFSEGIIPRESTFSAIVHPVQLYESTGCLVAIILIWQLRNSFKSAGNLFYLSGLTYYIVRLFTEFFRDSDAYAVSVSTWMGLNAVQWLMLVMIIGSVVIIVYKERRIQQIVINQGSDFRLIHLVYFCALVIVFLFASKWLQATEIFVVYIVLLTTAGYLLSELFRTITVPGFRIASLSLIFLSLLLMSQTYPEQATDSTRISYNTISVGGLLGSQDLTMLATDCDGNTMSEAEYRNKYKLMGMGFSRTVQTGQLRSYTLGISGYVGDHAEDVVTDALVTDRPGLTTYGVTPYGQADYPYFAFGAGVHFGDMTFINTDPEITSVGHYTVYPQFYFRFGRLDRFFAELNWARNFPSSFPGTVFQTNLGFPLKNNATNSGVIRVGTSTSTGLFLSASIPMGKHLVMEPYVGFLGSPFMKMTGYEENTATLGSLSLHYKFSRREIEP